MTSESPIFQPLIKIYPHKVNVFYYNSARRIYPKEQGANLLSDRKKAFQGFISQSAKRVIEERLSAWRLVMEEFNRFNFKLRNGRYRRWVFVTLTLSSKQLHSDEWIKRKLLEMFIKRLKSEYKMVNYFWKSEKQDNGNIHFHFLTDIYIPHERLREIWNDVQNYYGYLKDYKQKHNSDNPNSTDIHSVEDKRKSIKYIMKYVSKKDGDKMIEGRCWSMSNSVKCLELPILEVDSYFDYFIEEIKKKTLITIHSEEYFSVLKFGNDINLSDYKYYQCGYLRDYYKKLAIGLYVDFIDEIKFMELVDSLKVRQEIIEDKVIVNKSPGDILWVNRIIDF